MDGNVDMMLDVYTTREVTGDLQVVDWKNEASRWKHLKGIEFPSVGVRPTVDILIGLDYAELHFSIKDVRGRTGEPIARLTPILNVISQQKKLI